MTSTTKFEPQVLPNGRIVHTVYGHNYPFYVFAETDSDGKLTYWTTPEESRVGIRTGAEYDTDYNYSVFLVGSELPTGRMEPDEADALASRIIDASAAAQAMSFNSDPSRRLHRPYAYKPRRTALPTFWEMRTPGTCRHNQNRLHYCGEPAEYVVAQVHKNGMLATLYCGLHVTVKQQATAEQLDAFIGKGGDDVPLVLHAAREAYPHPLAIPLPIEAVQA